MVLGSYRSVSFAGIAASFAAILLSSLGFVLTKKWAVGTNTLAVTSWQLIAGGLLVLPFAIAFEGPVPPITAANAFGFAYVTVIATAVAFAA
jgi:probable blue pigment (indigoidine) exporter